jgi:aryl-alcohol dehydrogenase-like predicted oxidoreductase
VRQFEAEFLRMVGERTPDQAEAFAKMKAAFEMYQSLFAVISRETAPNDWATICAEMGYTYVAAMPIVDAATRKQFAEGALKFFDAASVYFKAGGFQQDLQKMGEAQKLAQLALGVTPSEPKK